MNCKTNNYHVEGIFKDTHQTRTLIRGGRSTSFGKAKYTVKPLIMNPNLFRGFTVCGSSWLSMKNSFDGSIGCVQSMPLLGLWNMLPPGKFWNLESVFAAHHHLG